MSTAEFDVTARGIHVRAGGVRMRLGAYRLSHTGLHIRWRVAPLQHWQRTPSTPLHTAELPTGSK